MYSIVLFYIEAITFHSHSTFILFDFSFNFIILVSVVDYVLAVICNKSFFYYLLETMRGI